MKFITFTNTPGCLPQQDEPSIFDTIAEAWWSLYHERCEAEREAPCDMCQDTMTHGVYGDCDDDTDTGRALAARAKADPPQIGTVYGPTPGYSVTGTGHDLGLAYSVEVLEPQYETEEV